MKLSFFGGAQQVTGSNYLLEFGDLKIVVDCGLFQGTRYAETYNYEPFEYKAEEIDFVLLTHSHADHSGRLPKLYKDGFRGKIYATKPTIDLSAIAIDDNLDLITPVLEELPPVTTSTRVSTHEIDEKQQLTLTFDANNQAKLAFDLQGDAPACSTCGGIMVRSGTCYKCLGCGNTSGCS